MVEQSSEESGAYSFLQRKFLPTVILVKARLFEDAFGSLFDQSAVDSETLTQATVREHGKQLCLGLESHSEPKCPWVEQERRGEHECAH